MNMDNELDRNGFENKQIEYHSIFFNILRQEVRSSSMFEKKEDSIDSIIQSCTVL